MYRLKIYLLGSYPPIWRRLLVHSSTTLHTLHSILQVLFDWEGCHMHVFGAAGPETRADASPDELLYGPGNRTFINELSMSFDDDKEEEDERDVTLADVLPTVDSAIAYEYDTGDSWDHAIQVEAIEPATEANTRDLPQCTGGRCAAPGEDTGGMYRHSMMVHKYREENGLLPRQKKNKKRKANQHEEEGDEEEKEEANDEDDSGSEDDDEDADYHDTVKGWLEDVSDRLGFKYDPLHFDRRRINRTLKQSFQDSSSASSRRRS